MSYFTFFFHTKYQNSMYFVLDNTSQFKLATFQVYLNVSGLLATYDYWLLYQIVHAFGEHMYAVLLDIYLRVDLLGHRVCIRSVLVAKQFAKTIAIQFSEVVVLIVGCISRLYFSQQYMRVLVAPHFCPLLFQWGIVLPHCSFNFHFPCD